MPPPPPSPLVDPESTPADPTHPTSLPPLRQPTPLRPSSRLADKVALITGCASPLGIGRASAHAFASAGPRALIVADLARPAQLHNLRLLAAELRAAYPGVAIAARGFDAADEEGVRAACAEALAAHGRLDVYFANAGVVGYAPLGEEGAAEFARVMRANGASVLLAARYASAAMREAGRGGKDAPGGSVVATASVAGLRANAGSASYGASKAAVIGIMQSAAFQLAGTGVRCNAVCPGVIETGMTSGMYEAARARGTEGKIGQLNPLRRGGDADEVARVALFLASDEASYVNGQAWAVCGGLSAGHPFVKGKLA